LAACASVLACGAVRMSSETVRGRDFEVLKVSPATASQRKVILIPGNPGLVEYYREVGTELSRLLAAPVVVVGYRGFLMEPERAWPSFDLEAQIAHARRVVNEECRGADAVALVGHSIGALVVLDLLRTTANVRAAAALMPFVAANDADPSYSRKKAIAGVPGVAAVLAVLAACLRRLPTALRARVLALLGFATDHMSPSARALTLDQMTAPANFHQYVAMGASEFRSPRILNGPDLSWRADFRATLAFVYADRPDIWVREADKLANLRAPDLETHVAPAPHDFPTSLDASLACAQILRDIIKPRFDAAPPRAALR